MCSPMACSKLSFICQWLIILMTTTNGLIKERNYERELHVVSRYEDLKMEEFSSNFTGNYTTFLFMNETLLVGARDFLLTFNMTSGLKYIKKVKWIPKKSVDRHSCIRTGIPQDECHNFIQVLAVSNNRLLTCGTNSHYPECMWRNIETLEMLGGTSSFYGKGLVSFNPHLRSTYSFVDGRLFSGLMMEFGGHDKAIVAVEFRDFELSFQLRTIENVNWLDDPIFHRTFLIGDYIYFFFDEFARECSGCDAVRYSRVARLCKKDDGGNDMINWVNFVTFQKARLNCSLSGAYPYHFNILRDIFWDSGTETFYGIFTTERSHKGPTSALCSYSMSDIEKTFSGTFKYKVGETWKKRTNPGHITKCKVSRKSLQSSPMKIQGKMLTRSLKPKAIIELNNCILSTDAAQPRSTTTSFYLDNIRFVKLALITFESNKNDNIKVWYTATDRGTILKLSKILKDEEFCVFKEYKIFPSNATEQIKTMELLPNKEYLLIGSNSKLIKFPLLHCDSYTNKRSCLQANDPLCGWSAKERKCKSWRERHNADWEQNITSCPRRKAEWSEWSVWTKCKKKDGNLCKCRRRSCVNARMFYKCKGADIELKSCTVDISTLTDEAQWWNYGAIHGGWSQWSQWSDCLRGYKNRSRTCTEPSPKNGGLRCGGSDTDYSLCEPTRFDDAVVNLWTSWNRVRGPERRVTRYKVSCTSKAVVMKGLKINVVDNETANCNKNLCRDSPKRIHHLLTTWSPWLYCNNTTEKLRMRQLCVKDLSDRWSCDQHSVESKSGVQNTTDTTTTAMSRSSISTQPASATSLPPTTTDSSVLLTKWSGWSPCLCQCQHDVDLHDKSLGIQHRNIQREKGIITEYKTCQCEVLRTESVSITTNSADVDVRYVGTDSSETGEYSLKMVIIIVSVCCLVCIIITALLLLVWHRKTWQTKKVKKIECEQITTGATCQANRITVTGV